MVLQPEIEKVLLSIIQSVNQVTTHRALFTVADMDLSLGVVHYSHSSGFSLQKGIETLQRLGCDTPEVATCRYI